MRQTSSADSLLLLSGGLDSSAVAALSRPELCLFVDYGQRSAASEFRSAAAIADYLSIPIRSFSLDLSGLGSGTLVGVKPLPIAPTEEWFPYRNLFLASVGASMALQTGQTEVMLGLVAEDGERHLDGTPLFLEQLDTLISMQEGSISVSAPFLDQPAASVIKASGLPQNLIQRTHSCHKSDLACGCCAGCAKRRVVLAKIGS